MKTIIIFDQKKLDEASPEMRSFLERQYAKREEDTQKEFTPSSLMGLAISQAIIQRGGIKYHHTVMENLEGAELLKVLNQNAKKPKNFQICC